MSTTLRNSGRLRIAALGYYHESNTFVPTLTEAGCFEETAWLHGDEIVRVEGEAHSSMAGFLSIADEPGVEVVPLVWIRATPSGTIAAATFERIATDLTGALERGGPWDAVLLALHGAAVAEGCEDADGEVAARVRAIVGDEVPIGLALDMHTNLSQRTIASVTATTLYRTNPHVDARERARECAEIIVRAARGEVRPVQTFVQVPAVINILQQFTGEEPMRGLIDEAERLIAEPGMLSASIAEGYPYADVADMGMAVLTVHDAASDTHDDAAMQLARHVWDRREAFLGTAQPVDAAVRAAGAAAGTTVLLDVGDNIGGGSPGDSTVLLEAAIRLGVPDLLTILFDPGSVAACERAGAGSTITLAVGGRSGPLRPIEVTGTIRFVGDGRFEEPTPTHGGFRYFDPGTTAILETTSGHTIVLMRKLVPPVSIRQLTSLGLEPRDYRVLVAKGVQSPRPAYEPVADRIVMVDTPGVTAAGLDNFTYTARRVPLYPFEPIPDWVPEPLVVGPMG